MTTAPTTDPWFETLTDWRAEICTLLDAPYVAEGNRKLALTALDSLVRFARNARVALEELRDMADGRADADCQGDPPRYIPNAWMQAMTIIDEVLK